MAPFTSNRLPSGPTVLPIVPRQLMNAGDSEWQEPGLCARTVVGQAPECERFELALSNHDRK